MRAIRLDDLSPDQLRELDTPYRTARDVGCARALMVLLAAEKRLVACEIAAIVCESDETARRWLQRYEAEGVGGLADAPRSGRPPIVTTTYRERLLTAGARPSRSLKSVMSLSRLS